jgi:hypothetical protein
MSIAAETKLSALPPESRQTQVLPFTVSLVTTASELARAVALRSSAYLRHNAPAAERLHLPEDDDLRADVVVLAARSKLDGGIVGTIRINPNFNSRMHFEASVSLPKRFEGSRSVEFMRLGVAHGPSGHLVSFALAKASYAVCVASEIDYIFVASRPHVDVVYRRYRFDDLLGGRTVELHYAPGVMHSILCLPVNEAEERWRRSSRSTYRFFVETEHPDLDIDYLEVARRFAWKKADSGVELRTA